MNFSANGLPKNLERLKAIHEPIVNPIVERMIPNNGPYRNPPMNPVTSPGIGKRTTWEAWRRIKPIKDNGPREFRKWVIFSLFRKNETRPVSYRINVNPAMINTSRNNLSQILLLSIAITELL